MSWIKVQADRQTMSECPAPLDSGVDHRSALRRDPGSSESTRQPNFLDRGAGSSDKTRQAELV